MKKKPVEERLQNYFRHESGYMVSKWLEFKLSQQNIRRSKKTSFTHYVTCVQFLINIPTMEPSWMYLQTSSQMAKTLWMYGRTRKNRIKIERFLSIYG